MLLLTLEEVAVILVLLFYCVIDIDVLEDNYEHHTVKQCGSFFYISGTLQ